MIIIDVETTGLEPTQHGVASIGAVAWPGESQYYVEPQVDLLAVKVDDDALRINGFTVEQLVDPKRPVMKDALAEFLTWTKSATDDLILAGWNGNFDVRFLREEFRRNGLDWPFTFRSIDLHSIAYFLMQTIDKFTPKHDGVSTVGLNYVLRWADLPPEPDPHNALTGAQCNLAFWKHAMGILENGVDMPEIPKCPKCDAPMSLRKPKQGGKDFDPFYGCTRYPECKGTISV